MGGGQQRPLAHRDVSQQEWGVGKGQGRVWEWGAAAAGDTRAGEGLAGSKGLRGCWVHNCSLGEKGDIGSAVSMRGAGAVVVCGGSCQG